MQDILALIDDGEIEAAERRISEVHKKNGLSGHDFQIAWQAIWEAKAPGYRGRRGVDQLERTVEEAHRRQGAITKAREQA